LHKGHIAMIRAVLDEGKSVLVALRDTPRSESDPYSLGERSAMVHKEFPLEIRQGRLRLITIPDIEEVVYGRKVGWGIREIRLDEDIESISGTAIRAAD